MKATRLELLEVAFVVLIGCVDPVLQFKFVAVLAFDDDRKRGADLGCDHLDAVIFVAILQGVQDRSQLRDAAILNWPNSAKEWDEVASADLLLVANRAVDAVADCVADRLAHVVDLDAVLILGRLAASVVAIRIADATAVNKLHLSVVDVQATIAVEQKRVHHLLLHLAHVHLIGHVRVARELRPLLFDSLVDLLAARCRLWDDAAPDHVGFAQS